MTNAIHKPAMQAPARPDDGEACYAEYLAVLGAQRGMLGELDALSQRQSTLVDSPEIEPLLAVLDERRQVIERIVQTSRLVDQLRERWEIVQTALPQGRRTEVERAHESLKELAAQVSRRDLRDHARLKKRMDAVSDELAGVATSRRAASAYGPTGIAGPRFQDQQG